MKPSFATVCAGLAATLALAPFAPPGEAAAPVKPAAARPPK